MAKRTEEDMQPLKIVSINLLSIDYFFSEESIPI